MSKLRGSSSYGTLSPIPSLGPLSQRSVVRSSHGNSSPRLSHRRSGLLDDASPPSARAQPTRRTSGRRTEAGGSARASKARAVGLTHPPKAPYTAKESNKESADHLARMGRRYADMKPGSPVAPCRPTVGSARRFSGIPPASARQPRRNSFGRAEKPPAADAPGRGSARGVRPPPMSIVSPRAAPPSSTALGAASGSSEEVFFRHEYVFLPEEEKARPTQTTSPPPSTKETRQGARQVLPGGGNSNGEILQKMPGGLHRGEGKGDDNTRTPGLVAKANARALDVDTAEGEAEDLKVRIRVTREKLERVKSSVKRYTETLYQRETEKNIKESILKELKQQVESYEQSDSASRAECRKLEVEYRSQEELAVLRDMAEERKVRLEVIKKKRDSLNSLWNQLQLLHRENSQENTGNPKLNSESPVKDACYTGEYTGRPNGSASLTSQAASEITQEQREFSVFSNNTRGVLHNFLRDLLVEVEELTKTCIQVPSPSDHSRMSQSRCSAQGTLEKGSNGFFSFFGGATEQHLSAKPLSTFLSGISRLERSAWRMEEEVQLRARELADAGEEDELRDKLQVFSLLSGTDLTSQHSEVAMTPIRTVNSDWSFKASGKEASELPTPVTPPQASCQKLQHLQSSPEFLPSSPIRERGRVAAAARGIMESHGTPSGAVLCTGAISMKPQELDYAYARLRDVSHDLDSQERQVRENYETEVKRQRNKAQMMAERLRDAYKTQVEPGLRARIAELRQQQVLIAHEFRDLGVAEVQLERKGHWATTENVDNAETCDCHHDGVPDYPHDVRERGSFGEHSSNNIDNHYSFRPSTVGGAVAFPVSRLDSSAVSLFSKRRMPVKLVNCVTMRTLQVATNYTRPQRGESSLNVSVGTAYEPRKSRSSKYDPAAMCFPSRTGTPSSCSDGDNQQGGITSRSSAHATNDTSPNHTLAASARDQMVRDLPPASSRARPSTGVMLPATPRREGSRPSITASGPERSLLSVSPITKTSPWLKNGRAAVLLNSPRGPFAISTPTSARTRVQGAPPVRKSRDLPVKPDGSAREMASSTFIEETFKPLQPTPKDMQTHLWGVPPNFLPDPQLDNRAVKVSLLFYGQEARIRRALEERNTECSKELWRLREELARLEEDAYNQRQVLEELEAKYLDESQRHAANLLDGQNKLKNSMECLHALKQEYEEWNAIREELNSLVAS